MDMNEIQLTNEQEKILIETLSNGGKVNFRGRSENILTWQLLEKEWIVGMQGTQKRPVIYSRIKKNQTYDDKMKDLYRNIHNI
jgi:hypothetical protein